MYSRELAQKAALFREKVRTSKPLVHNITNMVAANVTANALLACGAFPVMAHAVDEVAHMVRHAQALVLNIGTLTSDQIEAMITAGQEANRVGLPVVLDPVGVGATPLRVHACEVICSEISLAAVRGNASEVSVLASTGGKVKGVDASSTGNSTLEDVRTLSRKLGCVVAATGARDYVSDGNRVVAVDNGHPLLARVTGTGCMVSAIVGAFLGACAPGEWVKEALFVVASALAYFGLAAERAAESPNVRGPGTFQWQLMDELWLVSGEDLRRGAKIVELNC
ncbi:MAG: hydroxyethylthiazole kinase [Bacillota bacterium]